MGEKKVLWISLVEVCKVKANPILLILLYYYHVRELSGVLNFLNRAYLKKLLNLLIDCFFV